MRDDRERLLDILRAIDKIEEKTPSYETFLDDEMIQVWYVHHLQIIGEAAARLSDTLRENHPVLPWTRIIAMRNVLVHQYFGIDLKEIWDTVVVDIPELKNSITEILQKI